MTSLINIYHTILSIFIFIARIHSMEPPKPLSESQSKLLRCSRESARAFFAPWNRYKQLKKDAPYKTVHHLKYGSCNINYEFVEHIEHGNIAMAQCLLELGADPNADPNFERWSARIRRPITAAAQIGNKELCEFLINAGADVNATDDEDIYYSDDNLKAVHYNALWQAVYHGHVAIVELLFARGIQNPHNNIIELPWRSHISLHKNYQAMQKLLIQRGIAITMLSQGAQEALDTELIDHVNRSKYEWAKRTIERGANVNLFSDRYAFGCALIHAAKKGWAGEKFAKLLLENGADPNIANSAGGTPLMFAVRECGSDNLCSMLLAYGADQLLQTCNGHTALMIAAYSRRQKICPILIEHQREQEQSAVTLLLCIKHHESGHAKQLYRWRSELLRPYLERYTLKALLNLKDNKGRTAYDLCDKFSSGMIQLKPIGVEIVDSSSPHNQDRYEILKHVFDPF